jgi:DNA-binding NarL/FixJ family response regulator
VIADDHPTARLGIRFALQGSHVEIVAEAVDAAGAVRAAIEHRPDLCLLDVHMPGGGIAATSELARVLPDMPVVMLSVSDADEDLFEALRAGACGYLLKDTDPRWLPAALRGVFNGEAPLPRALTARLIREFQRRGREHRVRNADGEMVTLSRRESEVLALLRAKVETTQIGRRLGISPATVRRHVSDILRKLRVADRQAALVVTADSTSDQNAPQAA